MRRSLPDDVARLEVQAQRLPQMDRIGRLTLFPFEIQSLFGIRRCPPVLGGRQENAISPHDRRRPAAARNFIYPFHVVSCRPPVGKLVALADTRSMRPPKLR